MHFDPNAVTLNRSHVTPKRWGSVTETPTRRRNKTYKCGWCGATKSHADMRGGEIVGGAVPSTCADCRAANPGLRWCNYHKCAHGFDAFVIDRNGDPQGKYCREARTLLYGEKLPARTCVNCQETQSPINFAGTARKSPVCKSCDAQNPGTQWCTDHGEYLPLEKFEIIDGKPRYRVCRTCRFARKHGVTTFEVTERLGLDEPKCMACFTTDDLIIDHDHSCCPGTHGCNKCVRGFLCRYCNMAEGLLRTPENVERLAAYMRQFGLTSSRTTSSSD